MAQEKTINTAMPDNSKSAAAGADDAKLAEAVRAAEAQSVEDHATLMRVRRKLIRTMMVAMTTTFIALGIVIVAIIYKFAHDPAFTLHKKAPQPQIAQSAPAPLQNMNSAQTAENIPAFTAVSPFINTAPNSGADPEYFRKKHEEEAEAQANALSHIPSEQKLPLNPGDRLISTQISGNQLLMRVADARGAESIVIYDLTQGKIITRIAVTGQ